MSSRFDVLAHVLLPAGLVGVLAVGCVLLVSIEARQVRPVVHISVPAERSAPGAEPLPPDDTVLRVCADPNNLPYSNERGEGFENAIAAIVATDLGRRVEYRWWPQRRGFVRHTLNAGACDVIMGVPAGFELADVTHPYYRSAYMFVSRRDDRLRFRTFDDPRLQQLRIGVHVIGDDYANIPPAEALARRGVVAHVHGYTIYGDYSRPNPPADLITAVASGEVDVAIAWGPLAGYFARRAAVPLTLAAVPDDADLPGLRVSFAIAMAVAHGNDRLRDALNRVIARRHSEFTAVLRGYGVPLIGKEPST